MDRNPPPCSGPGAPVLSPVLGPVLALALILAAVPAARADGFVPISDEAQFLDLIKARNLRLALFDITLTVAPGGAISGMALGSKVEGSWSWQEGYFCREMTWSGRPIEYNCQLVEARGAEAMRFTVDRGKGRSATFRLE